jgi:hypothetical protein
LLRPYENFAPPKQKFSGALSPSGDIPEKQAGKVFDGICYLYIGKNFLLPPTKVREKFGFSQIFPPFLHKLILKDA